MACTVDMAAPGTPAARLLIGQAAETPLIREPGPGGTESDGPGQAESLKMYLCLATE